MEKIRQVFRPNFDLTFVCLHTSSSLSSFIRLCPSLRFARAKKSLIASSLTHHKRANFIYTTTSHYNFSIWDIFFSLQFFNSMGLLWVTIFYSPINHFGHINIRNWSFHEKKQQSTLTQQKSLIDFTYFIAPKCHIT